MKLLPPPDRIFKPLYVPEKTLMGPGPTNASRVILDACKLPMLGPVDPELLQVMDDCKAGIQYLFQTKNKYTFAVSGTGHAALECSIMNMVEAGDKVLVAENGIWGQRAANMIERIGRTEICDVIKLPEGKQNNRGKPIKIIKSPGDNFSLNDFEEGLKKNLPKLLFVTHGESSTGVLQPLDGIGELCHRYDCLLLVDSVAAIGGCPVFMDEQEIDILYSGSQKVLSCPPGPAPISFSPRAIAKFKSRTTLVPSFYFDISHLANYWGCTGEPVRYHHTGMMTNIYAFREGLRLLAQEGLENCWKRHQEAAVMFHKLLEEAGFELFVKKKSARLPTVTTIYIPETVKFPAFKSYVSKHYNVDVSGGLGPTAGKVIRVGLLGENCTKEKVDLVGNAMIDAFKNCQ